MSDPDIIIQIQMLDGTAGVHVHDRVEGDRSYQPLVEKAVQKLYSVRGASKAVVSLASDGIMLDFTKQLTDSSRTRLEAAIKFSTGSIDLWAGVQITQAGAVIVLPQPMVYGDGWKMILDCNAVNVSVRLPKVAP